jgi:hypothetical protein
MNVRTILLFAVPGLLLGGCATAVSQPAIDEQPASTQAQQEPPPLAVAADAAASAGTWPLEAQSDQQGAITVVVKPLNLAAPGATLDFEVSLDTHSVDLSMDLAQLATLTDGNGREVQATVWDAPQGGHHVSGTLSFPTTTPGGEELLDGTVQLTLLMRDVGVAERRFVWQK